MADYKKYGYGRWAVVFKPENKFIGFSGLKYIPELNEVEVGFRFIRTYWGMGIATEAADPVVKYGFNKLKLNRIIGLVIPKNKASIRVLEKIGLNFEKEIIEDGEKVRCYVLEKNG